MNARRGLVLDANILLRAVFGRRVLQILETYENEASFYSPEVCFQDAGRYIPDLSKRRARPSTFASMSSVQGLGKLPTTDPETMVRLLDNKQ